MAEGGQDPSEPLAPIGEVWRRILRLMDLAVEFLDALAELPVLRSDPSHPISQARLGVRDIGKKALRSVRVLCFLPCDVSKDRKRVYDT
jgi:hypothetical protein